MQILYYVLMSFKFFFFFVQRVRHGCIGKQVLRWYLRHFAATWDGRRRQGVEAELVRAGKGAQDGGFCSPSGRGPQCTAQRCCTKSLTAVEGLP